MTTTTHTQTARTLIEKAEGQDEGTGWRLLTLGHAATELESEIAAEVRACRQAGLTWERVGTSLGVSKQAAWERYAP